MSRIYLGPLPNGIQIHSSVDQRSSQLPSPSLQRVGPQSNRPLELIGLYACYGLRHTKHAQQSVQHEIVVAIVSGKILLELVHVLCTGPEGLLHLLALGSRFVLLQLGSLQQV